MHDKAKQRLADLIDEYGIERVIAFCDVRIKQLERGRDPEVRARQIARAKERRMADKIELESLREKVKAIKDARHATQQSA